MTTIAAWVADAEKRLSAVGSDAPRLEARLLAAHILRVDRNWIVAHPEKSLPEHAAEALLQRREAHEPLAYILGRREFYGRQFAVRPGVLIPRQETEALVDAALGSALSPHRDVPQLGSVPVSRHQDISPSAESETRAGGRSVSGANTEGGAEDPQPTRRIAGPPKLCSTRLLDLGTGSGALAVTLKLERPLWEVTASDVSPLALDVARENARELGADVRFVQSDGFASLAKEVFDLIVVNPPYVARSARLIPEIADFEPEVALYGGETGMEFYCLLAEEAGPHLAPGGTLIVELGDGMASDVEALFARAGWKIQTRVKDLLGIDRCLVLQP